MTDIYLCGSTERHCAWLGDKKAIYRNAELWPVHSSDGRDTDNRDIQ